MRHYNSEEYKKKMIQVYGESVVKDFEKFEHRDNSKFPETYDSLKERMRRYVFRIDNINDGIKADRRAKRVSNFYKHKNFTKFILISIEKLNQYSFVDFSENNDANWQIEHILPQANKGKYELCYVRSLGNLTLLSEKLNVKSTNLSYEEKRKLFWKWKEEERKFHLNKLYRRKTFEEQDVDERYKRLKRKFLKFFSANESREYFTLDKFEKIIGF